jgi:hypothetical protein
MANRVWAWTVGRGLVHEPDDLRPDNPPACPELLDLLARELAGSGFDLRHLYRLVLGSATYQLDAAPTHANASDDSGLSHARVWRLDAEVLLDALNQVLATGERYQSPIPEPFTNLPSDQRALALADGSIDLPFLEIFGRPPRNTSCQSERSAQPSALQAQHLLNSGHVQRKLETSGALRQLVNQVQDPAQRVEALYLRSLSRFPSEAERAAALAHLAGRPAAEGVADLAWALIKSKEFQLRR